MQPHWSKLDPTPFTQNVNKASNEAVFAMYTVRWPRKNTLKMQSNIRQTRAPWARRVIGMFVVVCLNMVMQPCAMAFSSAADHNCPHCPTPMAEEGAANSMHHAADSDSSSAPCDAGLSQCMVDDEASFDSRTSSIKIKVAPADMPLAIASAQPVIVFADYSPALPRSSIRSWLPGNPPSLNVLYCVYLD